jgi:hypothetical protein
MTTLPKLLQALYFANDNDDDSFDSILADVVSHSHFGVDYMKKRHSDFIDEPNSYNYRLATACMIAYQCKK